MFTVSAVLFERFLSHVPKTAETVNIGALIRAAPSSRSIFQEIQEHGSFKADLFKSGNPSFFYKGLD